MLRRRMRARFSDVYRTHQGNKFLAELGDPNAAPRPRREIQNLPHRTLVTDKAALARRGDLVTGPSGSFLLASQHTLTDTKRFLAVEINHSMTWERATTSIDPVARVEKKGPRLELNAALQVVFEPQRGFEEEDFDQMQYRVFSHEDIQNGDFLDGYKVMRTYDLMGLRVAELA